MSLSNGRALEIMHFGVRGSDGASPSRQGNFLLILEKLIDPAL